MRRLLRWHEGGHLRNLAGGRGWAAPRFFANIHGSTSPTSRSGHPWRGPRCTTQCFLPLPSLVMPEEGLEPRALKVSLSASTAGLRCLTLGMPSSPPLLSIEKQCG